MESHRVVSLDRTNEIARLCTAVLILLPVIAFLVLLAVKRPAIAQVPGQATPVACSGTLAGVWRSKSGATLIIGLKGNSASGTFVWSNTREYQFNGTIDNNILRGEWKERNGKLSGDMVAEYFPAEQRVHLATNYFTPNGNQPYNAGDFFCHPQQAANHLPTPTQVHSPFPAASPSPAEEDLPTSNVTTPQPCSGTFEADWSVPGVPGSRLSIHVNGDSAEGTYFEGKSQRTLKGRIDANTFTGDWEEVGGQYKGSGTFVFKLFPGEQRIEVNFYVNQKFEGRATEWRCEPDLVATSYPPLPKLDKAYDTDNFRSFDALAKSEQEKLITKNGPRMPLEYDSSDLSLRVFVQGGWPVVVDYGLDKDSVALMFIEVEGHQLQSVNIKPAERAQVLVNIPPELGIKPQVAKVRIAAYTVHPLVKEPAEFRLYGIAMGEKAVAALRGFNGFGAHNQLAFNIPSLNIEPAERLRFFDPLPMQTGSTIQLRLEPPTTIRPGVRPKELISFSATSAANFSNGRWEIRLVRGRKWLKVWEEKTGTILPNQPKSNNWDGIISIRRLVSIGNHALKITAWLGREDSPDWIVAQTDPNLVIVK